MEYVTTVVDVLFVVCVVMDRIMKFGNTHERHKKQRIQVCYVQETTHKDKGRFAI